MCQLQQETRYVKYTRRVFWKLSAQKKEPLLSGGLAGKATEEAFELSPREEVGL